MANLAAQQPRQPVNNLPPRFWAVIIFAVIVLIMAISTVSCDCNYHLKRAKKKCGTVLLSDTIYTHDTTLVKSVEKDTVFHFRQSDTVLVREGRMTIKYFYNVKDSTVYLRGKCDTVFVVKKYPVAISNTTLKPDETTWKDWILWLGFVLVLLSVLLRRR